jgi:hypothetical protein
MFVQIKDNQNLIRDTESRAILNTNIEELKTYYAEREIKIKEMQEKQALESKVNKDMSEIKDMLRQILTRT